MRTVTAVLRGRGFLPYLGTLLRMYILIWVVDRRPPHRCNREVHGRSEEEPVNVCFLYCYVLMLKNVLYYLI
jgi:hypothetical protein